jgi:hypothetical protein
MLLQYAQSAVTLVMSAQITLIYAPYMHTSTMLILYTYMHNATVCHNCVLQVDDDDEEEYDEKTRGNYTQ